MFCQKAVEGKFSCLCHFCQVSHYTLPYENSRNLTQLKNIQTDVGNRAGRPSPHFLHRMSSRPFLLSTLTLRPLCHLFPGCQFRSSCPVFLNKSCFNGIKYLSGIFSDWQTVGLSGNPLQSSSFGRLHRLYCVHPGTLVTMQYCLVVDS